MDAFLVMVANLKTSVMGFVTGAVYYLYTTGAKFPQTKQEWWALAVGCAFFGFGLVAKDATTGSRPQ